jgi:putative transposase
MDKILIICLSIKMIQRIFPEGEYFHIFNKSISNYQIFGNNHLKDRMMTTLSYYNQQKINYSLSLYLRRHSVSQDILTVYNNPLVKFIAYCIMPDHYHLLVKIIINNSISKYINDLENSYSRYFNVLHDRKGPLWQNPYKFVHIKSEEQFLHVLRYIHLNPTSSSLVKKPEDWYYSSYKKYISYQTLLIDTKEISINNLPSFVSFHENQIDYQKTLKINRKLYLE